MRDYDVSLRHNTRNSSLLKVSKTEITAETEMISAAHIITRIFTALDHALVIYLKFYFLNMSEFIQFPDQTVYMRFLKKLKKKSHQSKFVNRKNVVFLLKREYALKVQAIN